jgi:hypothetical protein
MADPAMGKHLASREIIASKVLGALNALRFSFKFGLGGCQGAPNFVKRGSCPHVRVLCLGPLAGFFVARELREPERVNALQVRVELLHIENTATAWHARRAPGRPSLCL